MLAALVTGLKGGKWFSLIDKVYAPATLASAFEKVKRNKGAAGVDHQTIEAFEKELAVNLEKLSAGLRSGTYSPSPVRRKYIAKAGGGERPLGIPTVRDRVVQSALRVVMEPIFEVTFCEHSYGFRPGRGCKDALREVDGLLKSGHTYVVDVDYKSYFDTIPRGPLMRRVEEQISDGRVLELLRQLLEQDVIEGMRQWTPTEGTPQGAVISPLLANIYLNPLDQLMVARGMRMVRYADDLVVLCRSREQADEALGLIRTWSVEAGLTLHPEKTKLVDLQEPGAGFDFLGYHFERGRKTPRKKSLVKFKDRIRELTPRRDGRSLESIITTLNRTIRGWFEYFKHAHEWTFDSLDGWIRERLRRMLRKRLKKAPSKLARFKWPNAFFHERGLFSMLNSLREAKSALSKR
ncbi:MAG: group II intron reverse transcriptase/maturase [Lentisphaerae bacterium RIFOXYA12_64_32]|nr:MAG: group II intron reverse transcriptase/maturase [Lentisphaerae bacterium RIFOXYA12_64_32]